MIEFMINNKILILWFVPVLSAQFMTAPTGHAREILNLAPAAPPRPEHKEISENINLSDNLTN